MIKTIRNTDFVDFCAAPSSKRVETKEARWEESLFAFPSGDIHFSEQQLHNDFSIVQGHYSMAEHTRIEGVGEGALLEIQFNLSQHDIHYHDNRGQSQVAPAQSGNIVYLSGADNSAKIHFNKHTIYNTFDVHLPLNLLTAYAGESKLMDRFLENIQADATCKLAPQNMAIDPRILNTIADIKGCHLDGLARKIYLESKVYEIIAFLTHNAENTEPTIRLTKRDQERVHDAARLLRERLDLPTTIVELSRLAGINQTKLKSGFRELFGTTIFGYLQKIKMHQAKQELINSDISIQELAYRLGYQNTSNFSIAFKKFHGCSPIRIRGRKINLD